MTDKETMRRIENMKDAILADYPRLNKDDKFKFSCHPGVSCFGECCGDVNIFLTPYDVIRLKKALDIPSDDFLSKYTLVTQPDEEGKRVPMIVIKMDEANNKRCPFLGENGCTVYEDRPWACRMYPLGMASGKTDAHPEGEEFFFLLQDESCMGLQEPDEFTIAEYIKSQGIEEFDIHNEPFREFSLHKGFNMGRKFYPQQLQMYFMACYNPDMFRRFVFNSSFVDKFENLDAEQVERFKEDDIELMKFAFEWLRFVMFGEDTLKVKPEVLKEQQEKLLKEKAGPIKTVK